MNRLVASRVLTILLLATITLSGLLSLPAAFASSSPPSFKHIDLISGDPQYDGFFGGSVAISGDLVVVGAPYEVSGKALQAGNAYVFDSTTGALVSSLTSADPQRGGEFGTSVAISGSLVVVGAPYETSEGQAEAGNAYAFNATTGQLIRTLMSGNAQVDGSFGFSVALSGDVAVVGAPGEAPNGQVGAGSAYILNATTGAVLNTLTSPNSQTEGHFGCSVAIADDRVAVGAEGEYTEGRAYLFDLNTGSLTRTLTSPNSQGDGQFGSAIAISGRVVVVGADMEAIGDVSEAGNAYAFNVRTGSLKSQLNSDPKSFAFFGFSVAIDGNVVAVGAPGQATGESGSGIAFTFSAVTGTLTHMLTNPNKNYNGSFGDSVSVSGKSIVVGAPLQTLGLHHMCGEAFVFQPGP